MTIYVQYVLADGTFKRQGIRVRCAPGNGDGSIWDEFKRGVLTPLDGDQAKTDMLRMVSRPEVKAYIERLPIARVEAAARQY